MLPKKTSRVMYLTGEHLCDGPEPRRLAILVHLVDHELERLPGIVADEFGHQLVELLRGCVCACDMGGIGRPTRGVRRTAAS